MIRIDEERLREKYREIEITCYKNGEIVPYLIDRGLPEEYGGFDGSFRLSEDEIILIYDNLPKVFKDKFEKNVAERIKNAYEYIDKSPEDYYDDELSVFLEKYPQFYDIIDWEKTGSM